jgi:hypothetical protein
MMKTLQQTYHPSLRTEKTMVQLFADWCQSQEKYRIGWLGIIIVSHGCLITPVTLVTIVLSGNSIFFWMLAMVAIVMCLVTNLAALPARITIPVFFLSILIDLVVIISCFAAGFNTSL